MARAKRCRAQRLEERSPRPGKASTSCIRWIVRSDHLPKEAGPSPAAAGRQDSAFCAGAGCGKRTRQDGSRRLPWRWCGRKRPRRPRKEIGRRARRAAARRPRRWPPPARDLGRRVLHQEPPPAGLRQPGQGAPDRDQGGGRQLARRLRGGRDPARPSRSRSRSWPRTASASSSRTTAPASCRQQIPKIFGKLLYGSKFHGLQQRRGQQGIGISAAGMYAQLTTGKPVRIISRIGARKPAHLFEIQIDTRKNAPGGARPTGKSSGSRDHGTRVEMELEATYKKGRRSVDDYVEQTALANPHAEITYHALRKATTSGASASPTELPARAAGDQAAPVRRRAGHPHRDAEGDRGANVKSRPAGDFSRVSAQVAEEICSAARLDPEARPRALELRRRPRRSSARSRRSRSWPADQLPVADRRGAASWRG